METSAISDAIKHWNEMLGHATTNLLGLFLLIMQVVHLTTFSGHNKTVVGFLGGAVLILSLSDPWKTLLAAMPSSTTHRLTDRSTTWSWA